jgi:hypothetical protein
MDLPFKLKQLLSSKRLIFAVSTGRSGTAYLSQILSCVPGVSSHHEARPKFSKALRPVQQNVQLAYKFWIKEKLPAIAKDSAPVYAETSHLFCKGFAEPLLDLGIVPDLILLTRPYRQVALSFCRFGTIPGRTAQGLKYLLGPDDPEVLSLPDWHELDDYQLCYWYCLEIERRMSKYNELFSGLGAHVVRVSLEEISSLTGFEKLLLGMNLPKPDGAKWAEYLQIKDSRINVRPHLNRPAKIPEDLDSAEQEVLRRVMEANEGFRAAGKENILSREAG